MVSVKVSGINDTIKHIKRVKKGLNGKMRELLERLAEEGYNVASAKFDEALYAGDKHAMVLKPIWKRNRLILSAIGESVAFIEFGTGTHYDYPDDYPEESKEGVTERGQYGKKRGSNPPWTYVGEPGNTGAIIHTKKDGRTVVKTYGNPPARAMLQASLTMRDMARIEQIAKEVFG
jgi:hypothetical protein